MRTSLMKVFALNCFTMIFNFHKNIFFTCPCYFANLQEHNASCLHIVHFNCPHFLDKGSCNAFLDCDFPVSAQIILY